MRALFAALLVLLAAMASPALAQNWLGTVERTPVSHFVGNPDAPVTLTEYISYTCPHCREYELQGGEALKIAYVSKGDLRIEYRHAAANPVDITASMMARCGPADKFPGNHAALMAGQPQVNALRNLATKSQIDRWTNGDPAARRRAIASDLGLYAIFERRGYSVVDIDQCLADQALADRIVSAADADYEEKGVNATPSFAVNGTLLKDVHNWQALQAALAGPLSPRKATE